MTIANSPGSIPISRSASSMEIPRTMPGITNGRAISPCRIGRPRIFRRANRSAKAVPATADTATEITDTCAL